MRFSNPGSLLLESHALPTELPGAPVVTKFLVIPPPKSARTCKTRGGFDRLAVSSASTRWTSMSGMFYPIKLQTQSSSSEALSARNVSLETHFLSTYKGKGEKKMIKNKSAPCKPQQQNPVINYRIKPKVRPTFLNFAALKRFCDMLPFCC